MMMSWEIWFIIGTLVLLAGLIYGVWQYRTRDRSLDAVREKVVKDHYENPEKLDG